MPGVVNGDPGRLRQVLLNLVSNAVKFTDDGSVEITGSVERDLVTFSVTDSGIGIEPSALPRLFQRFTQADASTTRRFGGSGLGLSICKSLVELMGGTIGVESVPGTGSRFSFTLPLPAREDVLLNAPVGEPTAVPSAQNAAGPALRVLVAEDNAANQAVAKHSLSRLGCAVDVAGNGREAVALWQEIAYDLILMDCQMPEMDGFEATREIRRQEAAKTTPRRAIHIVACTAGVTTDERDACRRAGMDEFLAKPLRRGELGAMIARIREAQRLQREDL